MSSLPSVENTLGVALVGVIVAGIFYGVSILQAYFYYTHQTDPWSIKLLVGLVMFFETIHQVLIIHTVYAYLILHYGRPEMLNRLVWSLLVEVLFNGFTALMVQSFLTMRVWRLSNRRPWVTGIAALLVAGEFGCVVVFTTLALRLETYTELAHLKSLSIAVNALAAAGDLLIATTLCIILHQSRTGFQRSDTMIKKLIVYSVNTGLLTRLISSQDPVVSPNVPVDSLCAVASLVSIVLAGQTFFYIMFFFCIGRLYSNSLLATLNARKNIRAAADRIHNTSDNMSLSLREFPRGVSMATKVSIHPFITFVWHIRALVNYHLHEAPRRFFERPTNISIKIDTTKEFNTDLMINECERDDGSVRDDLEGKRNELGMTFARKASSSTATTFADSPAPQAV
ncbi:hypothetical protein P691DRAFT_757922 [Macrolepiota fuliginosa MF-IS2]|uniref:DUF6534 domain-containing protein n=1 Tax=Macrolepiota fuliginosa MF-IS2 TaxID=1400762 RepID=A0A9P6C6U7_9AGAR|nr:hypothetical protein P691DRAFT_757922 [Macrolepiota fuliginosa MF-IS2]